MKQLSMVVLCPPAAPESPLTLRHSDNPAHAYYYAKGWCPIWGGRRRPDQDGVAKLLLSLVSICSLPRLSSDHNSPAVSLACVLLHLLSSARAPAKFVSGGGRERVGAVVSSWV